MKRLEVAVLAQRSPRPLPSDWLACFEHPSNGFADSTLRSPIQSPLKQPFCRARTESRKLSVQLCLQPRRRSFPTWTPRPAIFMTVQIIFPKLGFSMEAGRLVSWLHPEGASITAGVPLYEIESDK